MPAGMKYVRLVHLLDEQKRRELMIIYGENLAPTGFTAAEACLSIRNPGFTIRNPRSEIRIFFYKGTTIGR